MKYEVKNIIWREDLVTEIYTVCGKVFHLNYVREKSKESDKRFYHHLTSIDEVKDVTFCFYDFKTLEIS